MLRELLTRLFPRTNRLGRRARRALWAAKHRPWLEPLEDRLAPALLLVNSLADAPVDLSDTVVTLRDAIHAANNDLAVAPGGATASGADEIQFAGGLTGMITLNQGQLMITSDLTVTGPGAADLAISGAGATQVCRIDNADVTASLSGLTITDGNAFFGGGIYNHGTLTVTNSAINGNSAGNGAGIYNVGSLTVSDCVLSQNSAALVAGALINYGTLTLENSTLSDNSATNGAGGLYNEIACHVTVTNSTLSGNSSVAGGGILNWGTLTLSNTIVANSLGLDVYNLGALTGSHNLIETGTGLGGLTGTITADPNLGPLADNGGPTMTHALLDGSPAIDAGDNTLVPADLSTDQRGAPFARISGGTVDIGAFEVQQFPTITVPGPQTAYEDQDLAISGISVDDPEGDDLTVTLRVSHGTLTVGTTPGVSVADNGTGTVTLSGTISDLNVALSTLIYLGSLNFGGNDVLSITASDGSLSTSKGVAIHVKSAAEQAADLGVLVQQLVTDGVLTEGQGGALAILLQNNNGDAGRVQSFLHQLAAFVSGGILTQAQADPLLRLGNILWLSVTR